MKNLYIITLSLFSQCLFSQVNAICVYKTQPIEKKLEITSNDSETDRNSKKMLLKAYLLANDLDYILKFNQNISTSYIDESLLNEGVQNSYLYPIAKALIGKGVYFQNKNNNSTLRQVSTMGSTFIIKDVLKKNWKIINTRKKIGKYNCIKAILDCTSCNSTEIVWFTPDISVPFGPIGYGGLPGLIIEIEKNSSILRLKSIRFTKTKNKIIKPIKGKEISIDDYNEMILDIRNRARIMKN